MAGTSRDTNTYGQERSVSSTASAVEGNVGAEVADAVELAESADDASSRPVSPFSRSTKGFCQNCKSNVGDFYNSWYRITGSYYVPTLLGSYRSLLKATGRQKAASKGTDLEGCTIQPLSCPAIICTDSPIGFTVVHAPAGKRNFRGRDFFKLNRIELRCELTPNKAVVVVPQEDATTDLFNVEDSASSSRDSSILSATQQVDTMETDARPSLSQQPGHQSSRNEQHHEHSHIHQPLQQVEINRESGSSPSSPAHLHTLSVQVPASKRTNAGRRTSEVNSVETPFGPMGATQELPLIKTQSQSPHKPHYERNTYYPRSTQEVTLDAIERLQTQISQNSGALAAHTRDIRRGEESFQQLEDRLRREFQGQLIRQNGDIRRLDEAVARLHHEYQGLSQAIEGVSRDLQITRAERQPQGLVAPPIRSTSVQDSALEFMTQQIAIVSRKANEVDTLRIAVEIMKSRLQRLEEEPDPAPSRSPQNRTAPIPQSTHTSNSHHPTHTTAADVHAAPDQLSRNQDYHSCKASMPTNAPELSQGPEVGITQSSGWAAVNAGVKRNYPNGSEGSHEAVVNTSGSPKRQRLATVDSHVDPSSSLGYTAAPYEHMDVQDTEEQSQRQIHSLPSQHSHPDAMLVSQSQYPVYASFGTQDGPSDDSWRPESQRLTAHRSRGRGRGGGLGSQGGRGRKSMPAQLHSLGTPEWERDDWQGVPESQTSPDGYYNHVARPGRGIARRGSGGGGTRGGYTPSDRAASLGLQGVTGGIHIGSHTDPYAHTKKTRTKPIRNSDGVLIRKDGRPDMRSQSSAANLRKVHTRKEGDSQGSPSGFTPTNLHYATSADAQDTPSPHAHSQHQDIATRKHNAIMDKMFPSGVDESRKQHDYTRQVFEEDLDHTVHHRANNYHPAANSSLGIKQEHVEQSLMGGLHYTHEEGVDIDQERDHTDDEGQTPGEQSDNSEREYHETQQQGARAHDNFEHSGAQTVPETQTVDNFTTAAA